MNAKTPSEALAKLKSMPDMDDLSDTTREWVYFLKSEVPPFLVKIGKTDKLKWRIVCLQHGSPVALRLLGALNCPKGAERLFHTAFADDRQHGEWFSYSDRLQSFIKTMPVGEMVPLPAFVRMLGSLGIDALSTAKPFR